MFYGIDMRDDKRTTILLNRKLRKKLKEQCLAEDIPMKTLIETAIKNELKRRTNKSKVNTEIKNDIEYNDFASAFLKELEKILKSQATSRAIFLNSCSKFGVSPSKFSRLDLTTDFINFLCSELLRLINKEDVNRFGVRMRKIYKGRDYFK